MKQSNIRSIGAVGALIISLAVAGCGGGGGGYSAPPSTTPPPTTPPPTQAGGITGTGSILKPTSTSVVVNGTTFNATGAQVTDDRNRTLAEIEDGMTGKVRGRTDGTAQRIEIENELRGLAQGVQAGVDPQRFTVNGTIVYVDSQTLCAYQFLPSA